jgi:hypothetical protein
VGAGRFIVADADAHVPSELKGTLGELLAPALAQARGAMWATTGARLMNVERILLDEDSVAAYLRATPEPARGMIRDLAHGTSPRALLNAGAVEPSFLEEVLADVAARGAIVGVVGTDGADMLAPAIERVRTLMAPARRSSAPPSVPPLTQSRGGRASSSLADAVMQEISDRSPAPERISSTPPPLVEPSALRSRVASIPPDELVGLPPLMSDHTDIDDARVEPRDPSIPIIEASQPLADMGATPPPDSPSGARARGPVFDGTKPLSVKRERTDRTPMSSVAVAEPPTGAPPRTRWTYAAVLAAAGAVVWLALQTRSAAPPEPRASGHEEAPTAAVVPMRPPVTPTFGPIAGDAGVSQGEGLFELSMPGEAPVRVDGVPQGRGPKLALPLKAGVHEVLVGAEEHARTIEVRAGRATRLDFPETP